MRYLRNEGRDVFYDKIDAKGGRKIKERKYTVDPLDHANATIMRTVTKEEPTNSWAACRWCKTSRQVEEFVKVKHKNAFTLHWEKAPRILEPMETTNICIHCLCAMFDQWKTKYKYSNLDTLYMVCAFANLYYDRELAEQVLNDKDARFYDDKQLTNDVHFVDRYARKLEDNYEGPTSFWDQDCSPFKLQEKIADMEANAQKPADNDEQMQDEDKDNFNIIWGMYHYDPFEGDPPKDRRRLRANLVTMIDDAMNGDLVRMQAALEIVRAYYRIEKIGETLTQLQATPDDTAQNSGAIKQLTAAKTQETSMVTAFSKDHGFAAKYATAKSKGSGTLSAVIRDMKDAHYDFGTVNKYDIETSAAIKQVSDISAESIFKQVSFTSAEYADMVREQADEIKRLTSELRAKDEELRLFREKELKQELLEELKEELEEKGIPTENVEQMIEKEYNKNRVIPPL